MNGDDVVLQSESLDTLEDIYKDVSRIMQSQNNMSACAATRGYGKFDEFLKLVERMNTDPPQAWPVIRKLFKVQQDECNLCEEIWINDKKHALDNEWKSYTIIHVHYHETCSKADFKLPLSAGRLKAEVVDAVNVRHIEAEKTSTPRIYLLHPFKDTAIEPSGKLTLKIFPKNEWECKCLGKKKNLPASRLCMNCKQIKPCEAWEWQSEPELFPELEKLLRAARNRASEWTRGPKTMTRGPSQGEMCDEVELKNTWTLSELLSKVDSMPTRVCGLFIGINKYKHVGDLNNCARDAELLWTRTKAVSCGKGDVLVVPETTEYPKEFAENHINRDAVLEYRENFCDKLSSLPTQPKIVIFYFAGHGRGSSRGEYILMSNFKSTGNDDKLFEEGNGCLRIKQIITEVSAVVGKDTEKYFLFDTCRVYQGQHPSITEYNELPANTLLAFPVEPGKEAPDGEINDHSPFCRALAQHICKPGVPLHELVRQSSVSLGCSPLINKILSSFQLEMQSKDAFQDSQDHDESYFTQAPKEVLPAHEENTTDRITTAKVLNCEANTLKDQEMQELVFQSVLKRLELDLQDCSDEILAPAFIDDKSRSKNVGKNLLTSIMQLAQDLSGMNLDSFMGKKDYLAEKSCEELEGRVMEYCAFPLKICSVKSMSDASSALQQLPGQHSMTRKIAQADPDSVRFDYDGPDGWSAEVKISVYSKGEAISASDMVLKLEATTSMWVDAKGSDIFKDFEKKKKEASEKRFQHLGHLFSKVMREDASCFMDSEMEGKFLADALRHADKMRVEPIIRMGAKQIECMAQYYKLIREHDRKPYFELEEVYESSSFVAVFRSTRFSSWMLHELLEQYPGFRRAVRDMGFHVFWFDELNIFKFTSDEECALLSETVPGHVSFSCY
jgi:hypothetical protein